MQLKHFLVPAYIVLFTVVYFAFMFIGGYLALTFEIEAPSMGNILVIVASVTLINATFNHREKRPPSRNEFLGLVTGATLADVALEIYTLAPLAKAADGSNPWNGIVFVSVVHTLLFAVCFYPWKNNFSKPSAA